jgi:hypothetical protein
MSDEMKRELNGLRAEMHKGMGEMRHEMGAIRDVLQKGFGEMGEMRAMLLRTMLGVADLTGTVADMKRDMATKGDLSMLNRRMDKFAGLQVDANVNANRDLRRLDDHDKRLKRLESREA